MRDVLRYARCGRTRRGFSTMVTTLSTGVMAVGAMVVLSTLEEDGRMHRIEKRREMVRATAEGGMKELLNDRRLMTILPTTAGDASRHIFARPGGSEFWKVGNRAPTYKASVSLVRTAPAIESSQRRVRAVLYEVEVRGKLPDGESADMEAIIYRLGSAPQGRVGGEVFGK